MNFRTISKTDSGLMSNILVLISVRNRLKIYDLYNNLLSEHDLGSKYNIKASTDSNNSSNPNERSDSIKKIVTFHSNEGNNNK